MKAILVALTGIALSMGSLPLIRADNVEIQCSADTTIHEHADTANLGSHTHVASGSTAVPSRSRGLFRFNLAGKVPLNANITAVSFRTAVTFTPTTPAKDATFALHRILKPWGEGTGTGNLGRPALSGEASWIWRANPDTWGGPGGQEGVDYAAIVSASLNIGRVGDYNFSGTGLVEDVKTWLASPDANFGWMLMAEAEQVPQTARRFGSRESSAPAVLRIEYTAAAPELHFTSIEARGTNVVITWTGGNPPFQLQLKETLEVGTWANIGLSDTNTSVQIPANKRQSFFRVATGL